MSGVELPLPNITSWDVFNYVHRYL